MIILLITLYVCIFIDSLKGYKASLISLSLCSIRIFYFYTFFFFFYTFIHRFFPLPFRLPFLSHSFHSHFHSCTSPLPRSSPSLALFSLLTLSISVIHSSPLRSSFSISLILSPIVLFSPLFVLHLSNTCSHDSSSPPHTPLLFRSPVPTSPHLISYPIPRYSFVPFLFPSHL